MSDLETAFRHFRAAPDPQSLLGLLRSCQQPVYNVCFQTLGHAQDAEDAAQDVLLEIAGGAPRVREVLAFRRWMYRVAACTAIDHRLKRARKAALAKGRLGMVGPPADPSRADVRQDLTAALAQLDDDSRCLVIEHYFEKSTLEELGRRHGCSVNAVWKRIERAKERLKRSLAGAGLSIAIPHVDVTLESIVPATTVPNLIQEAVISKVTLLSLTGGIIVGTKTALSAATIVTAVICLSFGTAGGMLIQSRRSAIGSPEAGAQSSPQASSRSSADAESRIRELEQQVLLKDRELARARGESKAAADAGVPAPRKDGAVDSSSKASLARRMAKLWMKMGGSTYSKEVMDSLSEEERSGMMQCAAEFMTFLGELKALDPKNGLALFQNEKGRAYLSDFLEALCSEHQSPLDDRQRREIQALLETAVRESDAMDRSSPLAIDVAKRRLEARLGDQFRSVLNQDQLAALSRGQWSLAGGPPMMGSVSSFGGETPSDVAESVTSHWTHNLQVNEAERLRVSALSNQFANEYALLNHSFETRFGAPAVQRFYDWTSPQSEAQRKANADMELGIMELQLKYQKELVQVLGQAREAAIQNMSTTLLKLGSLR